jgi:hypothetical protein
MEYYQVVHDSPDIQVIIAVITAVQVIALAIISGLFARDARKKEAKQVAFHKEDMDYRKARDALELTVREQANARAELRMRESMLGLRMSFANMSLSIAMATAIEKGEANGMVATALKEAEDAKQSYDEFYKATVLKELAKGG